MYAMTVFVFCHIFGLLFRSQTVTDAAGEARPRACNYTRGTGGVEEETNCSAVRQPDVKNFTLKFPPTLIPSNTTNYLYMIFDLTQYGIDPNTTYHLVGRQIQQDNAIMLHHMLVYLCRPDENVTTSTEPMPGDLISDVCLIPSDGWLRGLKDMCYPGEYGMKIGKGGATKLYLQFHYNNPDHCNDQWDSSGISFFYTERLRPHSATYLSLVRKIFAIPPGRKSYSVAVTCSSDFTAQWRSNVTVDIVLGHMHEHGKSIRLEQRRNGIFLRNIFKKDTHRSQYIMELIPEPVVLQPGDQIILYCEYSTLNRSEVIHSGAGTHTNEMCMMFVHVYPAEALDTAYCVEPFPTSNMTVVN